MAQVGSCSGSCLAARPARDTIEAASRHVAETPRDAMVGLRSPRTDGVDAECSLQTAAAELAVGRRVQTDLQWQAPRAAAFSPRPERNKKLQNDV